MPKEFSRSRRVGDLLQQELAGMIQRRTLEDGTGMVTLSSTDVSPDLKNATIYFTCLGNSMANEEVVDILNEYVGEFQHELGKSLKLRNIPHLHFKYDYSLVEANRVTELIDSLQAGKKSGERH